MIFTKTEKMYRRVSVSAPLQTYLRQHHHFHCDHTYTLNQPLIIQKKNYHFLNTYEKSTTKFSIQNGIKDSSKGSYEGKISFQYAQAHTWPNWREKRIRSKRGRIKKMNADKYTNQQKIRFYDVWKEEGKTLQKKDYILFLSAVMDEVLYDREVFPKIFEIFDDYKNLSEQSSEQYPLEPGMYLIVIQACARAEQVDRAFEVFEEMKSKKLEIFPQHYLALIRACALVDQMDRAKETFDQARKSDIIPPGVPFEKYYKTLKEL